MRFGVWLLIGAVIYALYGYRHSKLRRGGGDGGSGHFDRPDGDPGGTPSTRWDASQGRRRTSTAG